MLKTKFETDKPQFEHIDVILVYTPFSKPNVGKQVGTWTRSTFGTSIRGENPSDLNSNDGTFSFIVWNVEGIYGSKTTGGMEKFGLISSAHHA